jgi:hypothetical protein
MGNRQLPRRSVAAAEADCRGTNQDERLIGILGVDPLTLAADAPAAEAETPCS